MISWPPIPLPTAHLVGIQEGLERTGLQPLINRRDAAAGRALDQDLAIDRCAATFQRISEGWS